MGWHYCIKDISLTVSEESNGQTGLKEDIPGSEHVALGRTLSSYNSNNNCNSSILQESNMSLLDIIKSLQNEYESITGFRTIRSF